MGPDLPAHYLYHWITACQYIRYVSAFRRPPAYVSWLLTPRSSISNLGRCGIPSPTFINISVRRTVPSKRRSNCRAGKMLNLDPSQPHPTRPMFSCPQHLPSKEYHAKGATGKTP